MEVFKDNVLLKTLLFYYVESNSNFSNPIGIPHRCGPPDLFSDGILDKCLETWTALLRRGPGVDRAPRAFLVAGGMFGEREGVPNALQSARATISRLSECNIPTMRSQTRREVGRANPKPSQVTFFLSEKISKKSRNVNYRNTTNLEKIWKKYRNKTCRVTQNLEKISKISRIPF